MLSGEQLEQLVGLVQEYAEARDYVTAAQKRQNAAREDILTLMKESGTAQQTVGEYTVTVNTQARETIPVPLARALLSAADLEKVLQTKANFLLTVQRNA